MDFRDIVLLTVYTGEEVLVNDEPFYKAFVKKAAELGLAGATVMKGIIGFAAKRRCMNSNLSGFFSGKVDAPLVMQIADSREKIDLILPYLEKNAKHSFVTITPCQVLITDYLREKAAKAGVKI